MILTDNETKVDLLNNEAIALTIISLLRERPEHPVTIGVHGDWGAGKSSVLEMIEAGFSGDDTVLCIKFNGWRFQGFEDAKIALLEGIVTSLIEQRPLLTKATQGVKNVFKRIDWLKVAKKAGGLGLAAYTGIPTTEQIASVVGTLDQVISNPAELISKENVTAAVTAVKSVLKEDDSKNVPEEVEAFRKAFDKLLEDAGIKQLVVLIDDLDRCLPDTAIETLEAVRLFVFTSRTAFVVAADEAMIEYAVRKHFPDLPETTGPRDYARNYLEKLIQVPIRIPALGETETRIYVTLLLTGGTLGENDDAYMELIKAAREKLKRPWESTSIDAATFNKALGAKAEQARSALILSDQIGPILASGSNGNPRQIKRFLNTLLLRQHIANVRGFGDEIKLPVLAKLMLAERFIPSLFEQIATNAVTNPQGKCIDLAALDKAIAQDIPVDDTNVNLSNHKQPKTKDSLENIPESAMLSAWKTSPLVLSWARVQPSLADIDLRPYLFVTKDKKDYFGPATALGHLSTIAEKLFEAKLSVQAMESDLKQLALPEAEKLFEAVRSKIISGDEFTTRPAGIEGMIVLVKAQPNLQSQLLDFLEGLPSAKCGGWVVGGWQAIIKDANVLARLNQLIEGWAKIDNNPSLKAVAASEIATRK